MGHHLSVDSCPECLHLNVWLGGGVRIPSFGSDWMRVDTPACTMLLDGQSLCCKWVSGVPGTGDVDSGSAGDADIFAFWQKQSLLYH